MTLRVAACRCGALVATCTGEPVRISVCHCHECQRRTGSAFSAQARFPVADVSTTGDARTWQRSGVSGRWARYHFCPTCGSTIYYENEGLPGLIAVPLGAFADDAFPPPRVSMYEERRKAWVAIVGDGIEHLD